VPRLAAALGLCALIATVAVVNAGRPPGAAASPAPRATDVKLETVGSFDQPVYVDQPPSGADGLLFVVEQPGRIKVVQMASGDESTFLDIAGRVASGGERGLLSVAFAPDYAQSGLFYVYYTAEGGDIRVEQYRRSPGDPLSADASSADRVIEIEHSRFANHNGGQLQFGPDGYLYVGTGDGGSFGDPRENAQNSRRLLGKLLRIDPAGDDPYAIPPGNPYVGRRGRDEVYALGLRNPWRFSFDTETGKILIGDVGQDRREEIDAESPQSLRGANFGWDAFEGLRRYHSDDASKPPKKFEKPIEDYSSAKGNCAVTGGYVVHDPALPALAGRYVYADFCGGELRSLIPDLGGARGDGPLGIGEPDVSSFGIDAAGHVYVASLSSGRVSRLVPG
jgi:glucose/arabinose dehydrogenase